VRDLKRTPAALGDGIKRPLPSEQAALRKMGKMLVAAHDLDIGTVLTSGDLAAKSPAENGLRPCDLDQLLGRTLVRELREDEPISADDVVA